MPVPGHVESLDPNAGVGYEIVGDLHQGLEDRYSDKWTSITQSLAPSSLSKFWRSSRAENRRTQWLAHE